MKYFKGSRPTSVIVGLAAAAARGIVAKKTASRKGLTCISIRADTRSRWLNGAAVQEERTCMAAIYARARAALRIGAGKNMEVGQIVGEARTRLDIATQ